MKIVPKILCHDDGYAVCQWDRYAKNYRLFITDEDNPKPKLVGGSTFTRWEPVKIYISKQRILGPFDPDTGTSLP